LSIWIQLEDDYLYVAVNLFLQKESHSINLNKLDTKTAAWYEQQRFFQPPPERYMMGQISGPGDPKNSRASRKINSQMNILENELKPYDLMHIVGERNPDR